MMPHSRAAAEGWFVSLLISALRPRRRGRSPCAPRHGSATLRRAQGDGGARPSSSSPRLSAGWRLPWDDVRGMGGGIALPRGTPRDWEPLLATGTRRRAAGGTEPRAGPAALARRPSGPQSPAPDGAAPWPLSAPGPSSGVLPGAAGPRRSGGWRPSSPFPSQRGPTGPRLPALGCSRDPERAGGHRQPPALAAQSRSGDPGVPRGPVSPVGAHGSA